MSTKPDEIDLCRARGDTFAMQFTVKDSAGVPINITGATFLMTVDPDSEPADATANLFQLTGTITDAVNGIVQFQPNATQMDQPADIYFYDIQMTDASSAIRTIAKGKFEILGDITK